MKMYEWMNGTPSYYLLSAYLMKSLYAKPWFYTSLSSNCEHIKWFELLLFLYDKHNENVVVNSLIDVWNEVLWMPYYGSYVQKYTLKQETWI